MERDAWPSGPTSRRDHFNVLPVKGEIDLNVSPSIATLLNAMIERKPKRLVVDLSSVTYVDSAGLGGVDCSDAKSGGLRRQILAGWIAGNHL
jgi:hypothetical protein